MALADIIDRIASEAASEAERIVREAEDEAARIREQAQRDAEAHRAQVLGAARERAARERETRLAAARLAARDRALTARRALVEEALETLVERIGSLPPARYAALLGSALARTVRDGDEIALGSGDAALRDAVCAELASRAPGTEVLWLEEPAPFERGALVVGERMRAEVTPRSLVSERRGELEVIVADVLFSGED